MDMITFHSKRAAQPPLMTPGIPALSSPLFPISPIISGFLFSFSKKLVLCISPLILPTCLLPCFPFLLFHCTFGSYSSLTFPLSSFQTIYVIPLLLFFVVDFRRVLHSDTIHKTFQECGAHNGGRHHNHQRYSHYEFFILLIYL